MIQLLPSHHSGGGWYGTGVVVLGVVVLVVLSAEPYLSTYSCSKPSCTSAMRYQTQPIRCTDTINTAVNSISITNLVEQLVVIHLFQRLKTRETRSTLSSFVSLAKRSSRGTRNSEPCPP